MNKINLFISKNYLNRDNFFREILKLMEIKEYNVIKNKYGKPYFEKENIYFNLSHSKEYIAAAFYKKEIGIDIQDIKPVSERMYRRCLSFKEQECINDTDFDKDTWFTYIWTRKEAYIKYLGKSILTDLSVINVLDMDYIYSDFIEEYCLSIYIKKERKKPEVCLMYI